MAASKGQIKIIIVDDGEPAPFERYDNCSFKILSGHLYITDVSQTMYRCVYAPGQWATVKVEWRDR